MKLKLQQAPYKNFGVLLCHHDKGMKESCLEVRANQRWALPAATGGCSSGEHCGTAFKHQVMEWLSDPECEDAVFSCLYLQWTKHGVLYLSSFIILKTLRQQSNQFMVMEWISSLLLEGQLGRNKYFMQPKYQFNTFI